MKIMFNKQLIKVGFLSRRSFKWYSYSGYWLYFLS